MKRRDIVGWRVLFGVFGGVGHRGDIMKVDGEGFEVMGEEKSRDCAVEVINVWSGPRSLSTSLMYSFAQVVSHLPLNNFASVHFGRS